MAPLLEAKNLRKSFFGVEVLHGVDLSLAPGEIIGLVGENGSGKSTTVNILGGVLAPDAGEILIDGEPYRPRGPKDAQAKGIGFIHQELNLFENLSIEENLFVGHFPRLGFLPFLNRGRIRKAAREALEAVDVRHATSTPVARLSQGERQLVEIAKAVSQDARIIMFDEPTTSLTSRETERLFDIIRRLRERGIAMIYISHILDDVIDLCDRLTILRDGNLVEDAPTESLGKERMIQLMVGRELTQLFPERTSRAFGEPALEVEALSQPGIVRDVNLTIRKGEVVGLAGLMGSGRSELARILFGLDPYAEGRITIGGKAIEKPTPALMMDEGMAMLTEERRTEGLLMEASIHNNVALPSLDSFASRFAGFLRRTDLGNRVEQAADRVHINTKDYVRTLAKNLSGGNQQKVVIAKWVMREPLVFILDEPTRGIDVGAKYEVYKIINALAENGTAVLMISSELEELIGVCDRILVMAHGEIQAEHHRGAFDSQRVLESAMWLSKSEEAA
ncbi:MAG: sugar ABC transporter ATP-binding protein [Geminicoccaceae bacterium]